MMNKIISTPLQKIQLAFVVTGVVASVVSNPPSVRAELPEPPQTGTPRGSSTPGGTRPAEMTCKETQKPLTALVANKGRDFTVSEYPTFWFYVPYAPEDISYIEFELQNQEELMIYRTALELTEKPGIIKVTIPPDPKYSLKLNEDYRWYFKLDCAPDKTEGPDLVLEGWVQRKSQETVTPQDYISYIENNIWYDAVNNLAERHSAASQNRELNDAWTKLLESIGTGWVVQEPFVASEILPPKD